MTFVRTFRRITNVAATLLLVAAAVVFLLVLLAQVTGRYRFVPVLSGSMTPFVETGDVAVLEPRPAADVRVGDVLAFEAPVDGSPLTLHRVIEIVSPSPDLVVRTQGDANDAADPWLARLPGDTHWRATTHVDDLGTPVVYLSQARTRFLWFSVAGVLLAWWGFAAIWREEDPVDDDDANAPEPTPPAPPRASRDRTVPAIVTAATLAAVLLVQFGGRASANASFTEEAVGSQRVSSAGPSSTTSSTTPPSTTTTAPPPTTTTAPANFQLTADLLCSPDGLPLSVELAWTAPAVADSEFDVFRSDLAGTYDRRIARVRSDTFTYSDPLDRLAPGATLHYLVRTLGGEQTNEATISLTCGATPIDPTPTTIVVADPGLRVL